MHVNQTNLLNVNNITYISNVFTWLQGNHRAMVVFFQTQGRIYIKDQAIEIECLIWNETHFGWFTFLFSWDIYSINLFIYKKLVKLKCMCEQHIWIWYGVECLTPEEGGLFFEHCLTPDEGGYLGQVVLRIWY